MVVPQQQFCDLLCRMVGDAADGVGQSGFGVDAVEPSGFHEAVDAGGTMTALVGTREQPVFAPDGNTAQRALGGIVVDLQATVVG